MGISIWHVLVVAAVVLLLFGTNRVPKLMEDLGKGISSFKRGLKEGEETKSVEDKTKE